MGIQRLLLASTIACAMVAPAVAAQPAQAGTASRNGAAAEAGIAQSSAPTRSASSTTDRNRLGIRTTGPQPTLHTARNAAFLPGATALRQSYLRAHQPAAATAQTSTDNVIVW